MNDKKHDQSQLHRKYKNMYEESVQKGKLKRMEMHKASVKSSRKKQLQIGGNLKLLGRLVTQSEPVQKSLEKIGNSAQQICKSQLLVATQLIEMREVAEKSRLKQDFETTRTQVAVDCLENFAEGMLSFRSYNESERSFEITSSYKNGQIDETKCCVLLHNLNQDTHPNVRRPLSKAKRVLENYMENWLGSNWELQAGLGTPIDEIENRSPTKENECRVCGKQAREGSLCFSCSDY